MEVLRFSKPPSVAEVIAELEAIVDKSKLVYLSRDEEGNGFAPLMELGEARVAKPARAWQWSDDLYDPNENKPGSIPCVVLWPGA
jgi:hypothetical protein